MNVHLLPDPHPGVSALIAGGFALAGTLLRDIAPWLQAASWCVSIAVGVCALYRFWRDRK